MYTNPSSVGGGRPSFPPPNTKVSDLHKQVDEVRNIAKSNVETVLKRDEKLTHLDKRAADLQQGAINFKSGSSKLKRKVNYTKYLE